MRSRDLLPLIDLEVQINALKDDLERLEKLQAVLANNNRREYIEVESWIKFLKGVIARSEEVRRMVERGEVLRGGVEACSVYDMIHAAEMRAAMGGPSLWKHVYEELLRIPLAMLKDTMRRLCGR